MRISNFVRILMVSAAMACYSSWSLAVREKDKDAVVPADSAAVAGIPLLNLTEARTLWSDPGTLFVDVRSSIDYEFGHIAAARYFGISTPDITLLPIGGVARLERMPEEPRQEFVIAVAGPLVNVAIAALIFIVLGGSAGFAQMAGIEDPHTSFFARLAGVNIFLVLFNMIPAFPMDGGRILRAALAARLSWSRATQVAATINWIRLLHV